jgi:hypothetical protein
MAEDKKYQDKNLGQQSNENWDDQNDQRTSSSTPSTPNPERYEDANLGQGSGSLANQNERFEEAQRNERHESNEKHHHHGSAFNEEQQGPSVGAGTSQRGEHKRVGPLDSDLEPLPSEKRRGNV